MKHKKIFFLIVVTLPAMAETSFSEIPEREGFFGGFSLGAGYIERTFDYASLDDEKTKFYMNFMGGYAFNPNLATGLEVSGWNYQADNTYGYSNGNNNEEPEGEGLYQVFAFGRYYPSRESGLFLKLGGGFVRQWTNRPGEDPYKDGWGAVTGIGYDYFISGRGSATFALDYSFGEAEDLTYQSITASVGIMIHQWKGPERLKDMLYALERRES